MPRAPRIEYPRAIYHVMARGDRREPIVRDDRDREIFVDTLFQAVLKGGWEVYAWVLMDNHYHLALRTPQANLVAGMSWFQNTFTRRINIRHGLWGHLFGGRYKAVLVESKDQGGSGRWSDYLTTLIDYIHLNPARAKLVDGSTRPLLDWRWSSVAQGYALPPSKRPAGLDVATGLELFGCRDDASGRRRFITRLDKRAAQERLKNSPASLERADLIENLHQTLERGWCWGSETFRALIRERFADQFEGDGTRNRPGEVRRKVGQGRVAEEILKMAEEHFNRPLKELIRPVYGDWTQVAIAWALVRRSVAKQAWIAEELGLRSWG